MTEDEAKEKWCPFARCNHDNGGNRPAYGNGGDGPVEDDYCTDVAMQSPCIGSACMAWRWESAAREQMRLPRHATEVDGEPVVVAGTLRVIGGKCWRYSHSDVDENGEFDLLHRAPSDDAPRDGYCGLAGQP